MPRFIASIDEGTTSTRCCIFDRTSLVAIAQKEHRQIFPQPGWVEHDPMEIWSATQLVVREAIAKCGGKPGDIGAIGITNQRETIVAWDRKTGVPIGNAIVWQDTRTKEICDQLDADCGEEIRALTGLPPATYFSAPKIRWILDNASVTPDTIVGTIDSWLIWNLSRERSHVTDVTNASRTMLMNIRSRAWDDSLLDRFKIPRELLPTITPSSSRVPFGITSRDGCFGDEIPICGNLGDQQAALVGQNCFDVGESKNTYGTGCFLLLNTGMKPVASTCGLLTTVAYQFENSPAVYALEGSIAVTGALVQWLRDNLGFISSASEIENLARSVPDNGGVFIVPAFSGLFAPHWRADARGAIVGLSRHSSRAHIARAALEATAFQTREVIDAMRTDARVDLKLIKVDGGMTANDLLMQTQADFLGADVVRPKITETTALGAAYAAGLAIGFWNSLDDLRGNWQPDKIWHPKMSAGQRDELYRQWQKAVQRTLNWVD